MKSKRPTREQYERNIVHLQQRNLNSDAFKEAFAVVSEYSNRENTDIEYKFQKLFQKFEKELEEAKYQNGSFVAVYKRYTEMLEFINGLPSEVVESNFILKSAKTIISQGYFDAVICVNEFTTQVSNYDGSQRYDIHLPLSKELSGCLLDWMITSEHLVTPDDDSVPSRYVNALPEEYIEYYDSYNKISQKVNSMAEKILNYQMMMILFVYPGRVTVELPEFTEKENGVRTINVDFLRSLNRETPKLRELK